MDYMTAEETQRFLMQKARTVVLSTVRPDGRTHSTPIWFIMDCDKPLFTTWHASAKAQNLEHAPSVSYCVQDKTPPFTYVLIESRANIEKAPPQLREWAARIARRYMGTNRAEEFGVRNNVPGEWLVPFRHDKIVTLRGVAD